MYGLIMSRLWDGTIILYMPLLPIRQRSVMPDRVINNVSVKGTNTSANALCEDCLEEILFIEKVGGAWERAKHWALMHRCDTDFAA
jgi:hypothetical protein